MIIEETYGSLIPTVNYGFTVKVYLIDNKNIEDYYPSMRKIDRTIIEKI